MLCVFNFYSHAEGPDYTVVERVIDFLQTCAYDKEYADDISRKCLQEGFNVQEMIKFFRDDLKKTHRGVCRNFVEYVIDEFYLAGIPCRRINCIKNGEAHVFIEYLSPNGTMALDPALCVQKANIIKRSVEMGLTGQNQEKIQEYCRNNFEYHMPLKDYAEKYKITSTFVVDEDISKKVCPNANDFLGIDLFTYNLINKAISGEDFFPSGVPLLIQEQGCWHFPPAVNISIEKKQEFEKMSESFRKNSDTNLTKNRATEILKMICELAK